jgi:hypothetical protein
MHDLVSARSRQGGWTNPWASAFRKLASRLISRIDQARASRHASIDPDRWSDAMLKDIGLEHLTYRSTDRRRLR